MIIALDLNGGDNAPEEIIAGALDFLNSSEGCGLILCSDEKTAAAIPSELLKKNVTLEVFSHSVSMNELPAVSKKEKSDNTVSGAVRAVFEKRADCAFSCGNSGAVILNAIDILGLENNVPAPVLMALIPMFNRDPLALLDAGATGNRTFSSDILVPVIPDAVKTYSGLFGKDDPELRLLNIGSEQWKGTAEHKRLYKQIEETGYCFKGNIEGDDILDTSADIVLTDGFTGNVVIKILESFGKMFSASSDIKDCLNVNNLLNFISEDFSYEKIGAAFLLGVNGKIALGHGKSSSKAVSSGLKMCLKYCKLKTSR